MIKGVLPNNFEQILNCVTGSMLVHEIFAAIDLLQTMPLQARSRLQACFAAISASVPT